MAEAPREKDAGTVELRKKRSDDHVDRMLDQAIEDTFPTSDPVSLAMPHRHTETGISTRWWSWGLPTLIVGGILLALFWRGGRG